MRAVLPAPAAAGSAELAAVTVASLANAVCLMGQQMGFVSNGRDAADRIREEGWRADFLTRNDARARAAEPQENTRLRPVLLKAAKGEDQLGEILAALARLEHTDGLDFAAMIREAAQDISRDTTVVAVLGMVTPRSPWRWVTWRGADCWSRPSWFRWKWTRCRIGPGRRTGRNAAGARHRFPRGQQRGGGRQPVRRGHHPMI
jgi:hypothetical protein